MSVRRGPWPLFLLSLGLSLLAHLLFVLFVPLVPREEPPPPLLQVRLTPLYRPLQPPLPEQPELLPVPGAILDALPFPYAPGVPGSSGFPEGPLGNAPLSSTAGPSHFEGLPLPQPKPLEFELERVELPDLDSLAVEGLKQEIEEREGYARLHLPDADTTDAASQRRRRARQVVERAIAAMGGWEALRAVHEMRVRVWVEATEHVIPGDPPLFPGPPPVFMGPYPYPVATWQYKAQGTFVNTPVKVNYSLDPAVPNEKYMSRNPEITKDMYYALFDARWSGLPPQRRKLREQAETARWHFLERFFGQGIVLEYLGVERFKDTLADVVQVEDDQYGYDYQALFDRRTGLLIATREGLTPSEQHGANPPVWVTKCDRYRPVQGVLTAHRLERLLIQGGPPMFVVVHLKIAYNGQEPDHTAPDLEE